jgi:prolipoprotein diacylglyceryl transferase
MSSLLPAVIVPAFIPSPSQGVWHLGPLPLRAYAICILIGIFAGYWLGRKRWVSRGGSAEVLADIMFWAIPFGLVGARIYHVLTDAELYFGAGRDPVDALKIWNGGLGVWGAIAFGALGAWIACRRHKVPFLAVADAMAPGIALAQAIGRFGNYFNQELFGRPTTRPWGLEIDAAHRPAEFAGFATFHPTFLYEAVWNLGVIAVVILVDRRFRLGHGRAFALYVATYCAGRAWIENLRIDTVNNLGGVRLNVWTALVLFVLSVGYLIVSARLKPGREAPVARDGSAPDGDTDEVPTGSDGTAAEQDGGHSADGAKVEANVGAPAAVDRDLVDDPAHTAGRAVHRSGRCRAAARRAP